MRDFSLRVGLTAFALVVSVGAAGGALAAAPESVTQVKYRSGKEIRFDELLIQGQMKRPEVSVVTGDQAEFSNGLLRLRENFLDHAANDLGEEIQ